MTEQAGEVLARLKIMFPLYTLRRCERGRGITAERALLRYCGSPTRWRVWSGPGRSPGNRLVAPADRLRPSGVQGSGR